MGRDPIPGSMDFEKWRQHLYPLFYWQCDISTALSLQPVAQYGMGSWRCVPLRELYNVRKLDWAAPIA